MIKDGASRSDVFFLLKLDFWNLFGIWDLELGISSVAG
jgi:hypothetical protein